MGIKFSMVILLLLQFQTIQNSDKLISVHLNDVAADRILGKWISVKKNLVVEVYKNGTEFKAKIVWFDDSDDLSRPMLIRTDCHNPDPKLRDRKLIGLDVLMALDYSSTNNCWENGLIYDANSGREWSSFITFTSNGLLRVKGYWHFKFIGQTIDFVHFYPVHGKTYSQSLKI